MFERSKSGKENRATFFGVDYICYVEGGGGNSEASVDVTFWGHVFENCMPSKTVHIVAKGGKPILERLAKEIIDEDVKNTLVAMDADYDELLGEKINDARVLYSRGYSWENDVFPTNGTLLTFKVLAHIRSISREITDFITSSIETLEKQIRWPLRADFLALQAKSSVFVRDTPGRYFEKCSKTNEPKVHLKEILKVCQEKNRACKPRQPLVSVQIIDIQKHCVGHIYTFGIANIICSAYRKFISTKVPSRTHIRDIGLLMFAKRLASSPRDPATKHFWSICKSIP